MSSILQGARDTIVNNMDYALTALTITCFKLKFQRKGRKMPGKF